MTPIDSRAGSFAGAYRSRTSGWSWHDGQFVHTRVGATSRPVDDWLIYRHWDPSHGRYGPVRDFYAYNGGDIRADNEIRDLGFEANLLVSSEVESLAVTLRSGSDPFVVTIPVNREGSIELTRNSRRIALTDCDNPFRKAGSWPRRVMLEASVFDRRVTVAIDGRPLFAPIDYDNPMVAPPPGDSPFALGVRGGELSVSDLRIYRDIYYTSALADTPRHPRGAGEPVQLGPDEFFVLGDNSPVSHDSRFWNDGPIVPGSMSWENRSWCICRAKLCRCKYSGGLFVGFPIRVESGTFDSAAPPRGSKSHAGFERLSHAGKGAATVAGDCPARRT